jgi:hypothetical protein
MMSVDSYVNNNGRSLFSGWFDNDNPIDKAAHPCLMYEMQEEPTDEYLMQIEEQIALVKTLKRRHATSKIGRAIKKACVSPPVKKSLCAFFDDDIPPGE